jgi:hypothetical protein
MGYVEAADAAEDTGKRKRPDITVVASSRLKLIRLREIPNGAGLDGRGNDIGHYSTICSNERDDMARGAPGMGMTPALELPSYYGHYIHQ